MPGAFDKLTKRVMNLIEPEQTLSRAQLSAPLWRPTAGISPTRQVIPTEERGFLGEDQSSQMARNFARMGYPVQMEPMAGNPYGYESRPMKTMGFSRRMMSH